MKTNRRFQWRWWLLTILFISSTLADSLPEGRKEEDYVWMTDPTTHERYQVLKSSYERDKAFVVSTLSNRFTREYLDSLADQCNAKMGPPGLLEFLNHTTIAVREFCFNPDIYTYSFEIYVRLFETISLEPYLVATLVAVVFSVARYIFTSIFLKVSCWDSLIYLLLSRRGLEGASRQIMHRRRQWPRFGIACLTPSSFQWRPSPSTIMDIMTSYILFVYLRRFILDVSWSHNDKACVYGFMDDSSFYMFRCMLN